MNLIQLTQGTNSITLQGGSTPFAGARYLPAGGPGETVREEITAALEGTPAQIEMALGAIGQMLDEARKTALIPGRDWVYLEARITPGGEIWRSLLLDGWLALTGAGADQRANGSQGVVITLTRANWWEGPEVSLPLSNSGDNRTTLGLTVYNHTDSGAGHANYAFIDAADLPGDQPAPAKLIFTGIDTDRTGTLYIGQSVGDVEADNIFFKEGEAGSAGAGVTSAVSANSAASGGSHLHLTWNGSADMILWKTALSAAQSARLAGRAYLPVLRLANAVGAGEKYWAYWRVTALSSTTDAMHDGPAGYLLADMLMQPAAAMYLPPWPVAAGQQPVGLGLELHVAADGSGAHALDIDFLQLLPLDGWRIYRPSLPTWANGLLITDDPYTATLESAPYALQMHVAEGPPLQLIPGQANRFYFLMERGNGGVWTANTHAAVEIHCRTRRKVI